MATQLGRFDRGDLSKLFQSLTLNSMHISSVSVSEEEIAASTTECRSSMVGRLWSKAIVTIWFLLLTMYKAWKTRDINVVKIWSHTYQLFFAKVEDHNRILSDRPGCFYDILLHVKAWDMKFLQVDDDLLMEEFCIHIWGLPYECVTLEVGKRIADSFESLSSFQIRESSDSHEKCFHLRGRIHLE